MTVALLPPKMDFVFKRIFGNENHPKCVDFISKCSFKSS